MDPFHVVQLAGDALDQVRREVWNEARKRNDQAGARWLKGARWALWKAPERLTGRQQAKLATIQRTNRRLYRAHLLKEQLRAVFHEPSVEGAIEMLDAWVAWAERSRLPASSSSPPRSAPTARRSWRASPTASPTPAWRRPTPASA
jgi:transposase